MSDPADVAAWVERLGDSRVLVVGDVMLDCFIHGKVQRISPEAPIPIVQVESENLMLGGAGNVARNVAALGATAVLVGFVGSDTAGRELSSLADETKGLEPHLVIVPDRRTTVKTRYVGGAQQLLRADIEDLGSLEADKAAELRMTAEAALDDVAAVVLSDYAKGAIASALLLAVISRAKKAGLPVIVDPKGVNYERYKGVTVLTPNAAELTAATRMPVITDTEAELAARKVLAVTRADAVIVTRGKDGVSVVEAGTAAHLPVRAREVFDVSGAGDTVVAALGAALAVGAGLREAAELANAAAGVVVRKVGTSVARAVEVVTALYARELISADDKITSLAGAVERVQRWRRNGESVAFTNGCFDLVHPGHVSLLRQARASADRLIVGLNTDASVRRLKGSERPVQGEGARAAVLAALADVDLVLPFGEDTPLRVIEHLRPDVLVKGADDSVRTVVGADLVQSTGGRIVLVELVSGESSSGIVERIGTEKRGKKK